MKTKVTARKIKENYSKIIEVGYCDLWYLLQGSEANYYTCGVYGWNADVYTFGNVAIVTGYRPFGNIQPKNVNKYNERAKEIWSKNWKYEDKVKKVNQLLDMFLLENIE